MKDSSAAFDSTILQGEIVMDHLLIHDWDNDGVDERLDNISRFVANVSVTQELTSQLPAQTRIIEGGTAAELTAQLRRGNVNWYGSEITYKDVATATSGSTISSEVTVDRPDSVIGDILVVFIGIGNDDFSSLRIDFSQTDNDEWYVFMMRSDTRPGASVESYAMIRRIAENEPPNYTWQLKAQYAWTATAMTFGSPGATGLSAWITKSGNLDISFTQFQLPEYRVPRDGSIVLSGFVASVTVTGASWTPEGGDIEIADIRTTRAAADNVAMGVQVAINVPLGPYTKSSLISPAGEVGVGFSIALAPFPPGNELQHAAWTFSELNPLGPYVGKIRTYRRMTWDIGVLTPNGAEYIRMFTGRSLATDGSSRSRSHGIIALDEREVLREPVGSIPVKLAENPFLTAGEVLPNFPGLDLNWVISFLFLTSRIASTLGVGVSSPEDSGFRNGYGFFASPPPRRSNNFYMPCHGSLHSFFSNVESLYAFTYASGIRRRVMFWDSPYVAATEQAPHDGGNIQAKWSGLQFVGFNEGAIWSDVDQTAGRIEFFARFFVPNAGGEIIFTIQGDVAIHFVRFTVTQDGNLAWDIQQNGGATRSEVGPVVPTDGEWHWYGLYWHTEDGVLIWAIDGVETPDSFTPFSDNSNTDNHFSFILHMENGAQIAEIHVDQGIQAAAGETSAMLITADTPWLSDFVPNAFIDKSDSLIDGTLFIDPTVDPWTILQEIANVDFAAVYLDAFGRSHWRNGRSDASTEGQTIVRSLTARDALMDIDYSSGISQIANAISVAYSPIEIVTDGVYFQLTGAIKVPANGIIRVTFEQPGPLIPNASFSGNLTAANTSADGTGTNLTVGSFILPFFSIGGSGRYGFVEFQNTYSFDVWLVDTSGQPSYSITASWWQLTPTPPEPVISVDANSRRLYRTQSLSIPSSMWRQREDAADAVATQLIGDLAIPRPIIRNVRIIGDPRLELGDLTRIQDEDGIGLDGNYRLSGLSSKFDPNTGFTQNVTAREGPETATWDEDNWEGEEIWGL